MKGARGLTLAIFVLLGVLATLWQGWGLPENWPPDEVPQFAAKMLRDHSANPHYFMYPSLQIELTYFTCSFLGLSPDGVGPGHVARTWSAIFYLLTVLFSGKAVEEALSRRSPFTYAFVGTIGALVHHAHSGNVNEGLFFAIALSIYLFVRTVRTGSERDFYLSVAACSLAVGAKYNGCFLFAILPLVWLIAFKGELRSKRFLRATLVSLAIAPIPFLLTTPYLVLDWSGFKEQWFLLTKVEGPAFKSAVGVEGLVRAAGGFNLGFFSPGTCVLLAGGLLYGLARWRRERPAPLVLKAALILGATLVVYLGMTIQIGIYQGRYFLPASIVLAQLFCLVFETLPRSRLKVATLVLLLVINSLNAWAHVSAFPHSAKSLAKIYAQDLLEKDPQARLGVIAPPRRYPLERPSALDARTDVFTLEGAHEGVETWAQYLDLMGRFFAEKKPRYLLYEGVVEAWPVFLPYSERWDYGKRLTHPNPGPEAWHEALARAGYQPLRTIENAEDQVVLRALLGRYYLVTAEGIGRPVFVYERRSGG